MKAYWTKILLGALAIFGVGMLLVSAGKRGVDHARQTIANSTLRLASANGPFTVDGRRMGQLSGLQLLPGENDGIPHIELAVKLDSDVNPAELDGCVLVVQNDQTNSDGIRCMNPDSVDSDDLVQIGAVTIESTGQTHALLIPRSLLDGKQWMDHFNRSSTAVRRENRGAAFQLQADSTGAYMMIRDEHGKPIFQMNADSSGAFIQVKDSNGKEIVRFHADSAGVAGNIEAP